MIIPRRTININGMEFIDVTNVTCCTQIYNYEEALYLSHGRHITSNYGENKNNENNKEKIEKNI